MLIDLWLLLREIHYKVVYSDEFSGKTYCATRQRLPFHMLFKIHVASQPYVCQIPGLYGYY